MARSSACSTKQARPFVASGSGSRFPPRRFASSAWHPGTQALALQLEAQDFAADNAILHRDVHPRHTELGARPGHLHPELVALLPAVVGIDRAVVVALAAAERVCVVDLRLHG